MTTLPLAAALEMLDTIWEADFEEKAFSAWCSSGGLVSFGEYLAQCRVSREPTRPTEEIYSEMDALFEGR